MFQFSGFASLTRCYVFNITGCPIRKSSDQFVFANTRSLSQLITSFFASKSQGILHTPLITFFFSFHHHWRNVSMQLLLRIPRTRFFVLQGGFLPPLNRFSDFSIERHLSVVTLPISQSKVALVSYFSICQWTWPVSKFQNRLSNFFSRIFVPDCLRDPIRPVEWTKTTRPLISVRGLFSLRL